MGEDEFLERYLRLCQQIYERMEREGTWPWSDSTEPDDVIDLDQPPK
jgi:hypothetical protein